MGMGSLQSAPMEPPSPARLYATAVGAFLLVLGIVGFFYSASFGSPGAVEAALGVLRANAWLNLLHIATGALGLLLAGRASRPYALGLGVLYTALAIWDFALGGGEAILGLLPTSGGNGGLHMALGVLGLAAVAATPKATAGKRRGSRRQQLEPRAKAAAESL
jgi:Domain of unknown function (DUF4383)